MVVERVPYADEVACGRGDFDAVGDGFSWGHVHAGIAGFLLGTLVVGGLYLAIWYH